MKFYFSNSKSKEAIVAKEYLVSKYGQKRNKPAQLRKLSSSKCGQERQN